jgi:hypothetical protein
VSKFLLILGLLLISGITAVADCPASAICPMDGDTGNPTGNYKWQGAVEFAEFSHPRVPDQNDSSKQHVWWVQCDPEPKGTEHDFENVSVASTR